jgi:hypothetical protein
MIKVGATRFFDGRVGVAALVNNGDVWTARQTVAGTGQAYSSFVYVPTGWVSDIDLDLTTSGTLFLVGLGSSGVAYQRWESSPNVWSGWSPIGNSGALNITTDRYNDGKLYTAVGTAQTLVDSVG